VFFPPGSSGFPRILGGATGHCSHHFSAQEESWKPQTDSGKIPDLRPGFYSDLMGFNGDLMGFYSDLMGFNGDLMGFYSDLMGY